METLEELSNASDSEDFVSKQSIHYTEEISALLQGFGDISRTLPQTLSMINDFVYFQMTALLTQAAIIAEQRKSDKIGIEEFMFLCRKNKKRLFHYMRHMHFRDSKCRIQSATDMNDEESLHQKTISQKRRKACMEFLNCIDHLNELKTSFNEGKFDDIRLQRLKVAELVTRNMDMNQYKLFCSNRQISFSQDMTKFTEWFKPVLDTQVKVHLSKFGWESMAYFAHETVAELVHLTLLVKSEQYATTKQTQSVAFERMLLNSSAQTRFSTTPDHIHEALRRCTVHFKNANRPALFFHQFF